MDIKNLNYSEGLNRIFMVVQVICVALAISFFISEVSYRGMEAVGVAVSIALGPLMLKRLFIWIYQGFIQKGN